MLHDFLALMYSMAGVHVSKCDRLNGAPIPRGMKGRTVHFGWPMDLVLKESHFDEILVCPPPTHAFMGTHSCCLSEDATVVELLDFRWA